MSFAWLQAVVEQAPFPKANRRGVALLDDSVCQERPS